MRDTAKGCNPSVRRKVREGQPLPSTHRKPWEKDFNGSILRLSLERVEARQRHLRIGCAAIGRAPFPLGACRSLFSVTAAWLGRQRKRKFFYAACVLSKDR